MITCRRSLGAFLSHLAHQVNIIQVRIVSSIGPENAQPSKPMDNHIVTGLTHLGGTIQLLEYQIWVGGGLIWYSRVISLCQALTRGQKVQSRREREIWNYFLQFREEKEKFENPFPSFEKRKRNLKKDSQLSRRERERNIIFSSFKRRKRKWK